MCDKKQYDDLAGVKLDATIRDKACTKPITSSHVWLEVRDVMSVDVATISPDQTVITASILMSERRISCVVVVDNEDLIGILTETDQIKKIIVEGEGFYDKPVAAVMSKSVESVSACASVLAASRIIQKKHIKRLPVLLDNKLVGIVTQTDLTRSLAHYGTWRDVAEIMSSNTCTIQRKASIAEAAKAMSSRNISSAVVMDNEDVTGIVTQRDLLTKILAKKKDPQRTKVEEAMSSPPICVPPNYSVFSASRLLEDLKIRKLVVMEGKKLSGIVTQTDIFTAIKNKLQIEEEKNLRLLEQSPSCIFTTNLEGKITYVNPAFIQLFEISDPQKLLNQPILSEQFWVNHNERYLFVNGYTKWRFESPELALRSSKGKNLYVMVFSTFTTDAHGVINGRQGIIYDLTDRREAAKQQDQLIHSLKKSNMELENFAHAISHDLKTPLRGIITLADWIITDSADKLDDEGKENLKLLRMRADRIYNMISGIKEYCKIGNVNKGWINVNINEQVVNVIDLLNAPSHIEITIEDDLPIIYANPAQIGQIFQNLLSNAIKYNDKPHGCINLSCTEEDNFWKFELFDNGPGIEEQYYDKIFKMFQTLAPRDQSGSTGIGLTLVKKTVEAYGGNIWVESVLGQGSTFIFTLPRKTEKVEPPEFEDSVITNSLTLESGE